MKPWLLRHMGALALLVLLACDRRPEAPPAPKPPPSAGTATERCEPSAPALPATPLTLPDWVGALLVELRHQPSHLELFEESALDLEARFRDGQPANCRWTVQDRTFEGCKVSVALDEPQGDLLLEVELSGEGRAPVRLLHRIPAERLSVAREGAALEAEDQSLELEVAPRILEVLGDTTVTMRVKAPPGSKHHCLWELDDQGRTLEGCEVSHVYREGLQDRLLRLRISRDGRTVRSEAIPLLLDRLPVRPDLEQNSDLPEVAPGEDCQRLLLVRSDGPLPPREEPALGSLVEATKAQVLLLFLHGEQPSPELLLHHAEALRTKGCSLLPLPCNGWTGAREEQTRQLAQGPLLLQSNPDELPERLSAQWERVFLAFLAPHTGLGLKDERWLTEQLQLGAAFPFRLFLSCGALDTLEAESRALLPAPYRLYEKLQRGGVGLVVSVAQPVWFHGFYGLLGVLSPGQLFGPSGTLLGQVEPQGNSAAMLELCQGRLSAVLYLVQEGGTWKVRPKEALPDKVGVFRRN